MPPGTYLLVAGDQSTKYIEERLRTGRVSLIDRDSFSSNLTLLEEEVGTEESVEEREGQSE